MANNVIGFYGTENYDIVLYLARILVTLKRNVLIVDQSNSTDLLACIPVPDGLYVEDDVIDYNGVSYTRRYLDECMLDEFSDVLIYMGFNNDQRLFHLCTELFIITNQQLHNIQKIIVDQSLASNCSLIVRDVVESKITPKYIISKININVEPEKIYIIYWDDLDIKNKLLVQYNSLFEFRKISREMREYLIATVIKACPGVALKDIKRAYKVAERG